MYAGSMRRVACLCSVLALALQVLLAESYSAQQKREIIWEVWSVFNDRFCDPGMRGVNWVAVRDEMLERAAKEELEPVVFEMIARLRNSHSGYLPASDRPVFFNVLPFAFERRNDRVFVAVGSQGTSLGYGDEVLSIDGRPATALRPVVRNYLFPRLSNPYYGAKDSMAQLELSGGRRVAVHRVRAIQPKFQSQLLTSGTIELRFLRWIRCATSPLAADQLNQPGTRCNTRSSVLRWRLPRYRAEHCELVDRYGQSVQHNSA